MRVIVLILFCASAFAQPIINHRWQGTNSIFVVSFYEMANGKFSAGKVKFRGENSGGHPANVWNGSNGWLTVDYGEGQNPKQIVQFRIMSRIGNTMTASNDSNGEVFTLHRQ